MSKYFPIDCANCGHQTEVDLDDPEDTCLFCGKNARKKEDIMAEKEAAQEAVAAVQNHNKEPVPTKPKNRRKLKGYWEKNREAVVADYLSMRVSSFFKRWGISSNTWQKLREKWQVPNKTRGRGSESAKTPKKSEYKEPRPGTGEFCLLITEEDLAKLDDDDFMLIWVILGRIIKNRLK